MSLASMWNSFKKEIIWTYASKGVSTCTVGSTATDCGGSFQGEKSFQILGSQDLNSSAASLVIAAGSSGKADTAV